MSIREFHEKLLSLNLSSKEIAVKLNISESTARRWLNGENYPHNVMRNPILRDLSKTDKRHKE